LETVLARGMLKEHMSTSIIPSALLASTNWSLRFNLPAAWLPFPSPPQVLHQDGRDARGQVFEAYNCVCGRDALC
jgi:hypothetical protein